MGKKRKASGQAHQPPSPETSAKISLNTWEDVADEQDEFLLNRDKILLDEGAAAKRRRQAAEEGWFTVEVV
jgi:U3 small nucleolar RNA-associated protein 3